MSEETREQKRRACEQECMKCQTEYQRRNPYDNTMTFLRNRCSTCSTGLKLKQLDPPENRGRVGNWQPW